MNAAHFHVFLSAVSGEFQDERIRLKEWLAKKGLHVSSQESLSQGDTTLWQKLHDEIARSQAIICVIGAQYGAEQRGELPNGRPDHRSWTQWEFWLAWGEQPWSPPRRQKVFVFIPADLDQRITQARANADAESLRNLDLQAAHIRSVKDTGIHYDTFTDVDDLIKKCLVLDLPTVPRGKPRNLPYESIGTLFKGRDAFLAQLRAQLQSAPDRAAAIISPQAIHGLGGVGKTRFAVEYAWQHQADYSALLFVSADTAESLRRNLAALCGPLVLNLPEQDAKEEEARVKAALRWLLDHPGWFLILDNVDTQQATAEVERVLAQLHGGHVLITSRISDWGSGVTPLELDVLSEDDSIAFLMEKTKSRRREQPTDKEDARAVAKELDGLALALEQAGAFITSMRESFAGYLARWRQRERKVQEWFDERLMKYPRSVAVTWDASFDQLDAPARALLRILCWFGPETTPRAVLETNEAKKALRDGVKRIRKSRELLNADFVKVDTEDALTGIGRFSLLKWETGNNAFRIHRLVEEVTRHRIPSNERESWLLGALIILNAYLPADPPPQDVRSWPRWEPVRGHVATLIAAADAAGIAYPTSRLMNDLALLLNERCVWSEAESLYRRALAIHEACVGKDHPNVATPLSNLGRLLEATNRLAEAEPPMRRALAICETSFGKNHPNVATALSNLASLLLATNRLAEAEPLMRRALAIDEASFGKDNHKVATALNNVAQLLQATNRPAEAEPLMRRALAIGEASLGKDHPSVATQLNNLANLLQDTNRRAEAEPLMRRALDIDEASFGKDHPKVAIRLNNLAQLLQATNRPAEAEPLMRRVVAIFEAALGGDHPNVATALINLGALLQATNRPAEAEPLMRRALAIDETSFGKEHPNVATDLANLAALLHATNRPAEAEPLMRRCLETLYAFQRAHGHEHPNLRAGIRNYRILLRAMNLTEDQIADRLREFAP